MCFYCRYSLIILHSVISLAKCFKLSNESAEYNTIAIKLKRPLAKPGPDRIGSDRQNSDRINNKFPAQSRQMKTLGHQLRLLPSFADVLLEKIRTRVSFNKILTNYTPEESSINMGYWPSVRSRWLDIGQVLFLRVYGPRKSRGP